MVVVGADVHKRTHTFVAVDEVGRQLGSLTVNADRKGHAKALRWARQTFPGDRIWGIEDCRHLSARLERDLLAGGESVVRVPPKLMAQTRASARTRGKSDPIDALAVARAVLREPDLPVAAHDEASRELKLLVDRRDDLVGERTRMINRFRWHLHELDPALDPSPRSLDRGSIRSHLIEQLARFNGIVAEMARDVLDRADHTQDQFVGQADHGQGRGAGRRPDRPSRLRGTDRSQDHRRDR
jgi:transposase